MFVEFSIQRDFRSRGAIQHSAPNGAEELRRDGIYKHIAPIGAKRLRNNRSNTGSEAIEEGEHVETVSMTPARLPGEENRL